MNGTVERLDAQDNIQLGMSALTGLGEDLKWNAHYDVKCYNADGSLAWREEFSNLVTTVGKNLILTSGLLGQTNYIGFKNTGSAAAGDTMSSHAGWTENVTYSQSVRQTWTPGAVASGAVSNSGSLASFTANGSTTWYGAFVTTDSTKSGTTGTLISVGDFGTAQPVISGNIVAVQVDFSLT